MLRIALPAVAGFLGVMLYKLVDIFWIARLGSEAVAGAASAEYWTWAIEAVMEVTTIGCSTLVAQAVGAGDAGRARLAAREAVHLSLLVTAGIGLSFYWAAQPILGWMGLSPQAQAAGWAYLRVLIFGLPLIHLGLLANQIFNAHGETRLVVYSMAAGLAVNAALDPLLMFGWWGFPRLGVAGAAWATVAGWGVGLSLRAAWLRRRGYIPEFREFLTWSSGRFGRMARIGAPTAAAHLVWTAVYPLLTPLITRFGMEPLAGMAIAHRYEAVAYFVCLGFAIAVAAMVGQAAGRGDLPAVRAAVREGRRLITWALLPLSALFVLVPEWFMRLTTQDPATVAHGAAYLRAIGCLEVFLGWELVLEGAFNGLGRTRGYMMISIPLTLGRYPAAYALLTWGGFGVGAVWWCISVTTGLKALALSWAYRRLLASEGPSAA